MSNIKHAIISAAGLGSRLGLNKPKCLLRINGKSIINLQLNLLTQIEDVRVIVGFKEQEVINEVLSVRRDVTFVRNPDFSTTSNSYSLYLATKDFKEPYLTIDGDLIINKESFNSFLQECDSETIIGVSRTNSEDAVFVVTNKEGRIISFTRELKGKYEWAGIAYLNNIKINPKINFQYENFLKYLPLRKKIIDCLEIDTPNDLAIVLKRFEGVTLDEYLLREVHKI